MATTRNPMGSDDEDRTPALNDDLDAESLADINSPADGYFEQRDIPQQAFVQNPGLPRTKSGEAAAEQSRSGFIQSESSAQQPRSGRWADEATPFLDPVEAPPDYESATAGQREQQRQAFSSEHPLVRNGLLSDRSDGGSVHSSSQPQSMRDSAATRPTVVQSNTSATDARDYAQVEAQPTERSGLLGRSSADSKITKGTRSPSPGCGKACLLTLVVFTLIVFAIVMTMTSAGGSGSWTGDDSDRNRPGQEQPEGPTPLHPGQGEGNCIFNSFSPTETFDFMPKETFEFLERIEHAEYVDLFPYNVRISGTVKVSPADDEQEDGGPDIKVWANVATTGPLTIPRLHHSRDGSFLQLHFPEVQMNHWRSDNWACFDISVAIHVRKHTRLNVWKTSATHLNIVVDEKLFADNHEDGLIIHHDSTLHTVAGRITAKNWNSRRTLVETVSGKIEGTFALYDELRISSGSGDIKVDVDPQEADEDCLPAEFVVQTTSGSISAVFPSADRNDIPDRDYRTNILSRSGTVSGSYILGRQTDFTTTSAKIDIAVLPYSSTQTSLSLTTETTSGRTAIQLLEPYLANQVSGGTYGHKHREGILDSMRSQHKSLSGDIEAKYPQSWEGTVDSKTLTGSMDLRGRDLELWFEDVPWARKQIIAHKGKGDSNVRFRTTTGDIKALIGNYARW